jgi:glycopeptide antibiotics resistance protein
MASRTHYAAPVLLAVVVVLILYVSLYPFRLVPDERSVVDALGLLTWARASRSDMFNNVLLYVPLGFVLALLVEPRWGRIAALLLATLGGAALSLSMELLQASIALRVPSLTDLSLNTVGSLAGAVGGSTWHALGARMAPTGSPQSRSRAVAMAVVVLWLATRLWPLVPDFGLRQIKRAVRPLFSPQLDPGEILAYFLGWLIVSQAIFHLAKRQRAIDVLLIVIVVTLVLRAFTRGNTLVLDEIAALVLLLPALVLLSRATDALRSAVLAAALAGWLAWQAFAPALGGAGSLDANIASISDLLARNPPPPVQLAGKGFSYVALGWLLAGAGLFSHVAASVMVLFVLALCLVQLGAAVPVFSWVDLVIAIVAGVLVSRWRK